MGPVWFFIPAFQFLEPKQRGMLFQGNWSTQIHYFCTIGASTNYLSQLNQEHTQARSPLKITTGNKNAGTA